MAGQNECSLGSLQAWMSMTLSSSPMGWATGIAAESRSSSLEIRRPLTKVPVTLPTVQPCGSAFVNSYGNVNGVGVQDRLLAAFTSSARSVGVCGASEEQVTMPPVTGVGV